MTTAARRALEEDPVTSPTTLRPDPTSPGRGDRRAWWGLAVLVLPVLLVSMDMSVLYLALPAITADLDPSASEQLWILDAYGFLIAGLLITMGSLGDRIGRRRILLLGASLFGLASVIAAFAPTSALLIAARALMGIGGATLLPSSLSLITDLFADPRARGRAIGVWTAFFAGGAVVGPIIGGVLLHHFWWGSVFLINVPVLLVLLLVAPALLPERRVASGSPLDLPSVVMSVVGIMAAVYAVKHVAEYGLDAVTLVTGAVGVGLIMAFVRRQRILTVPLVDLSLLANREFTVAIGSSLAGMMSLAAFSYLSSIYLQSVTGRDPLAAAYLGVPLAVTVFASSMYGSRIAERLGVSTTFVASLVLAALGSLMLLGVGVDGGVAWYVAGSAVAGLGYGTVFTLVSEVAVGSVPEEQTGAAVGVSETSFELGNALGLALLGSLAAWIFAAGGDFAPTLGETLESGAGAGVIDAAKQSFVDGMHLATAIGAGLMLLMAALAARSRRR